jgi:hypothetical protein
LARSDIEKLFDDRIEGILRLIDNQLQALQDEHPNDKLVNQPLLSSLAVH